jgi:hypothetical protein
MYVFNFPSRGREESEKRVGNGEKKRHTLYLLNSSGAWRKRTENKFSN